MSSETGTTMESAIWAGLTLFLAWAMFGIFVLSGVFTASILISPYFVIALVVSVLVLFMLDVWDQHRAISIFMLMFIYGAVSFTFVLFDFITFLVCELGIFLFLAAALSADQIFRYWNRSH